MNRTYVRRRRVTFTVTAVLIGLALLGPVSRALAGPDMQPAAQRSYVVRSGDTLWAIADRVDPGSDPRATVQRILDANGAGPGMDPGSLTPGQVLVIPSLG